MADTTTPDIGGKEYYKDTEATADLFNAVLFSGKELAESTRLTELNPEDHDSREVIEAAEGEKSKKKRVLLGGTRDMLWSLELPDGEKCYVVLISLENQTYVDLWLPLRLAEYNIVRYAREKDEKVKAFQEDLQADPKLQPDKAEKMAKKWRSDLLTPVFTIVLYYGAEPWDGPRSFRELFDVPPELEAFFPEIPLLLVELCRDELIFHNEANKVMSAQFQAVGKANSEAGGKPAAKMRAVVEVVKEALASGVDVKDIQAATELFDSVGGTHIARMLEEAKGDAQMSWNLWEKALQESKQEGERTAKKEAAKEIEKYRNESEQRGKELEKYRNESEQRRKELEKYRNESEQRGKELEQLRAENERLRAQLTAG